MLSTNTMMTTIMVAAALLAGTYFGHKFQTIDYSSAKSTEHGTSLDASRLRLLESRIEHLTVTVEELVGRQTSDSASNKGVELHLLLSELANFVEQQSNQFYSLGKSFN